jgi:hypothetical protein
MFSFPRATTTREEEEEGNNSATGSSHKISVLSSSRDFHRRPRRPRPTYWPTEVAPAVVLVLAVDTGAEEEDFGAAKE